MIEGLQPYPEYKESGQKWLGRLPSHWSLLPNRALFEEVKDRNHPNEEMLSVTITRGIVRQKSLLSDTSKKDSSNLNKTAYKLVRPGDIAYNTRCARGKARWVLPCFAESSVLPTS